MNFWTHVGVNMFFAILFPGNQENSRVLYVWQAELSHVGFSEEKVIIIITRWGYRQKCNWQAANRFELFAGNIYVQIKNPGIMSCILIRYTYDKNVEINQPLVQE
jgi:hypothetical protein